MRVPLACLVSNSMSPRLVSTLFVPAKILIFLKLLLLTWASSLHNFFLVFTDLCSGFTLLEPIKDKYDVTIARTLFKIFSIFGFPREIQSDRGTEFCNLLASAVNDLALIKTKTIAPWNPRANGAAENRVKQAKSAISKTALGDYSAWETFLPNVQMAINVKPIERTGTCPFTLVFNRASPILNCLDPLHPDDEAKPLSAAEILARARDIRALVYPEILRKSNRSKDNMAAKFNARTKRPSRAFKAGAAVMVKNHDRKGKGDVLWNGPYLIFEVTKANTLRLSHMDGTSVGSPVTIDQCKLVKNDFWKDIDDLYEIDRVLEHRISPSGEVEFLVHWKDYPESDNSWVKQEDTLSNKIIAAYWENIRQEQAAAKDTKLRSKKRLIVAGPSSPSLSRFASSDSLDAAEDSPFILSPFFNDSLL